MGLSLNSIKDFALILLEGAAMIYPPLQRVLGEAMANHDASNATAGEMRLADEIRAKLGVKSASQAAADALDDALLRPQVKDRPTADDESDDGDPPVPSAPAEGGRS